MQIPDVSQHWKKLWDVWDVRAFVILSLFLQTFLIMFAPLRKRTANKGITVPLWLAYLLADWAAGFAVGLISNNQANDGELQVFWASFLLLHLGGPDTITAFALEDNELWLRHLFNLIFQCLVTAYLFFQTLPRINHHDEQLLLIPTILIFLVGAIKYCERTRALYLASMDSFRDSVIRDLNVPPNYAKFMKEYASKKEVKLRTRFEMILEPDIITEAQVNAVKEDLTEEEVILHAYRLFDDFKGLIVDLIFSAHKWGVNRGFFFKTSSKDAFSVVEAELNFIYEVLYTKVSVVHCMTGYILRAISFGCLVGSLVLFCLIRKKESDRLDVGITYTLLVGAIAIDVISFLMLIFSNWTMIALAKSEYKLFSGKILTLLIKFKREKWFQLSKKPSPSLFSCLGFPPQVFRRRWSESIPQYNLIFYYLHQRSKFKEKIIGYLGLSGFLDGHKYVKNKKFTRGLRDFIFEELLEKSRTADEFETAKKICSQRGGWVLRKLGGCDSLLHYVEKIDYDESLLLWHIATEVCYNEDNQIAAIQTNNSIGASNGVNNQNRVFAKLLSDYMFYLLKMQPDMMSTRVGIWQILLGDTSAEAIDFFHFRRVKSEKGQKRKNPDQEQIEACRNILQVNTDFKPMTVMGDRSKSVLFDACVLAKKLRSLEGKDKWVIMSKVWVEMLSYAACNCRAYTHAQQLCKGGELITLVWLLMFHFGLADQFLIRERAKLIVK